MAKALIAYFSRADENYFGGAMRYVKVGNTEIVVNLMKDLIEADTFKIEMKEPYSPVYMTCIEEAKKDLRSKARPELASYPDGIDGYDTVIPIRTIGALSPWRWQLSSKDTTSPARRSYPSAPTREAAWAAASARSSIVRPERK